MMMMQQQEQQQQEQPTCAVCMDILENPHRLSPCSHVFCQNCLALALNANGNTNSKKCPLCRQDIQSIHADEALAMTISQTIGQCEACKLQMTLPNLKAHKASCSAMKKLEQSVVEATTIVNNSNVEATVNRSTFSCPFPNCGAKNLEHKGLIEHLDTVHCGTTCAAVCPVCVAFPWGDKNYVSRDVVGHIKLRHKFEYNEFVDYQESNDEDAVLQAVLARSMQDA